jgi:hypothetical protein
MELPLPPEPPRMVERLVRVPPPRRATPSPPSPPLLAATDGSVEPFAPFPPAIKPPLVLEALPTPLMMTAVQPRPPPPPVPPAPRRTGTAGADQPVVDQGRTGRLQENAYAPVTAVSVGTGSARSSIAARDLAARGYEKVALDNPAIAAGTAAAILVEYAGPLTSGAHASRAAGIPRNAIPTSAACAPAGAATATSSSGPTAATSATDSRRPRKAAPARAFRSQPIAAAVATGGLCMQRGRERQAR